MWSEKKKVGILLELTVLWEDNFVVAEDRKVEPPYSDLLIECQEKGMECGILSFGLESSGIC